MRKRVVKHQNLRDKNVGKHQSGYWNYVKDSKECPQANPDTLIDLRDETSRDYSINSEALELTVKQLPQILTEAQYDTYVLHFVYGWTRNQISKQLYISPLAVDSRIKLISKKIKNQFNKYKEEIKSNEH